MLHITSDIRVPIKAFNLALDEVYATEMFISFHGFAVDFRKLLMSDSYRDPALREAGEARSSK